jgi:ankyrin repeat protein
MDLYLTAGMDPNAAKRDHTTALMSAVQGNHIEIIKMLLAAGADVNASRALTHNTALDDAATTGQEAALQLLLEAGADSDTVDRAFVRAVAHKEMGCFYILLDHGVSQTAIDNAFVMAAVNSDHALLQTLSDRITDQSHAASEALLEIAGISKKKFRQIPEATRTESIMFLFVHGADVNAWNENGFTPLGLAVSNQNLTLAQLLLANNANIDIHSKCKGRVSSWTPLTLAI